MYKYMREHCAFHSFVPHAGELKRLRKRLQMEKQKKKKYMKITKKEKRREEERKGLSSIGDCISMQ